MKILSIVHAFPPDHGSGAEWMLHDMYQYMMAQGHECKVWVTKYPAKDFNGIEMVGPEYIQEADLLWSHLGQTGRAVNIARESRKPLLNIVHNTQKIGIVAVQKKGVYNVFNSYYTLDALKDYYGRHPYIVYHPSIDPGHYEVETSRKNVTLINLNPGKGGHILEQIAQRMPKFSFLAVKGAYGDQHLSYPKNVRLYENMDDIREIYRETGILIMPSNYESYGRTAVEAMCSGIPVIANPTPGLVESCANAGIFADRNNIDEWIAQIRSVFNNYQYHSKKAKLRATELDEQSQVELKRLEQFCRDIVANKFKHNL